MISRADLVLPDVVEIVDGAERVPTDRLEIQLEDNFAEQQLGHAVASSAGSVEEAIAAAHAVHASGAWTSLSIERRAEILDAIGVALAAEIDTITTLESFSTGVPIRQISIVGMIVHAAFHLAAQQLRDGVLFDTATREDGTEVEVHRLPLGPSLNLVPWNSPAPMAAHKVASALAAGTPTILKPSEYAPYGTTEFGRIVNRVLIEQGVPGGMFQLVQGGPAVGASLVSDERIRAVSFTGGLGGGRAIAAACAADFTALQLELGGNNPLVVLEDADPEAAARAAVDLLTTLNGQWCRALGRLVVHESLADTVVELALDRLSKIKVGDQLDPETDFGPIVHAGHREALRQGIAERVAAGGTAHSSTEVPAEGNFLAPTLITGAPSEACIHELFGPVATVHTFSTDEEAVALANATPFGLEGYVFSADEERALAVARQVRAGEVKVNGSTIMSLHLMTPRPAWGWSGMGEEGTAETIRIFTGARVVGVENAFALHSR